MRRLHSRPRALILSLAVLAAPRVLPAQGTSPSLPPELVTALFSGGSGAGAGARYYVGIVPPGWPTELAPPASITVVGGMQAGSRVVSVFADSTMRLPQERLRKQLEDAGWSRPPLVSQEREGFSSGNSFQSDDGRYGFWCRDSVRATVMPLRAARALTYVRLTLETLRTQPCVPSQSVSMMDRTMLMLPVLLPPERVRQIGGEGSSSGHSLSRSTHLADSTTAPSTVLAHYAAQLSKAGWTVHPPEVETRVASQAVEAHDKDGYLWYGMLIVITSAKTRDVAIMMTRMVAP